MANKNNMSAKKKKMDREDDVKLSIKMSENSQKDMKIRTSKVDIARENIAAGRYGDCEIVNTIVERLMRQFGI